MEKVEVAADNHGAGRLAWHWERCGAVAVNCGGLAIHQKQSGGSYSQL